MDKDIGNKKKPWYKRWKVWLYVIAALIIFGWISDVTGLTEANEARKAEEAADRKAEREAKEEEKRIAEVKMKAEEEEKAKQEKAKEAERRSALTIDELIKEDILKLNSIKSYDSENTDVVFNEIGGVAIVTMKKDSVTTANMERKANLLDAVKLFEAIFKIDDVQSVTLNWELPLVDTYGNEEMAHVMRIELKREEADKVNWERFDKDNFEHIANQYFIHPALR